MGLSRLLGSYLGKNANCVDEREHCYGVIAWFAEFLHPQIKKKYITIQTIFQVLYHCVLKPMFQLQNQSKNLLKNVK